MLIVNTSQNQEQGPPNTRLSFNRVEGCWNAWVRSPSRELGVWGARGCLLVTMQLARGCVGEFYGRKTGSLVVWVSSQNHWSGL